MTILESLATRYNQLALTGKLPISGFAPALISFAIVLSPAGSVMGVNDERVGDARRKRPRAVDAPQAPSNRRGKKIVAGTFWDPSDYALGVPCTDVSGIAADAEYLLRRTNEKHQAFKTRHEKLLANSDDLGCAALLRFFQHWTPEKLSDLAYWSDIPGKNIAFRLKDDPGFIHDRPAAQAALKANDETGNALPQSMCLVTGEIAPIARLHPPIKGIGDKLAPLVSFNEPAFTSYGNLKGANAPVSEAAAFAYATGLNGLLAASCTNLKGHPVYPNRMVLGETTLTFWAEDWVAEKLVRSIFDNADDDEGTCEDLPLEPIEDIKHSDLLSRALHGTVSDHAALRQFFDSRVYVLGISPNAARLSVRFWVEQSLSDFADHFQQHWKDLELDPLPHPWPPPLQRLLLELAPQRKAEHIPPLLSGEIMRAILTGLPYPRTLLIQIIMRIRSDTNEEDRRTGRILVKVTKLRVALLKAYLARMRRFNYIREEVPLSLDVTNTNSAYLLGRLFSVLERLQSVAFGQRHMTVQDRFYATASATPALVFPFLIRNSQNHRKMIRSKGKTGLAEWFDNQIADITFGLDRCFPNALVLDDQGRFALGYYHQHYTLRQKKDFLAEIESSALSDSLRKME